MIRLRISEVIKKKMFFLNIAGLSVWTLNKDWLNEE